MSNAIPTTYAGVNFRSRLEARWAAFFDLCEQRWEYEPIDLDGYIPDFILPPGKVTLFGHPQPDPRYRWGIALDEPILVEVKPIVQWPCRVVECTKCNNAPRDLFDEAVWKVRESGWTGPRALAGAVLPQLGVAIPFDTLEWDFVDVSGGRDTFAERDRKWREAGNIVQWRPR